MDNLIIAGATVIACLATFIAGIAMPKRVTSELDLTGTPVQVTIECKHNPIQSEVVTYEVTDIIDGSLVVRKMTRTEAEEAVKGRVRIVGTQVAIIDRKTWRKGDN